MATGDLNDGLRRAYTVAEWCEKLGCDAETLRRAIRARQLLASVDPLKVGRPYVITNGDMQAFLAKRRSR